MRTELRGAPTPGPVTRGAAVQQDLMWFQEPKPALEAVQRFSEHKLSPTHVYTFWEGMGPKDKSTLGRLVAETSSVQVGQPVADGPANASE